MQRQWEICWTAPVFDAFIFHHIVLIWILLKNFGRRWRLSFVNSRRGRWMLFQMRFRMLFTLWLSLIVPAGSASADMRFNFENCYKENRGIPELGRAVSGWICQPRISGSLCVANLCGQCATVCLGAEPVGKKLFDGMRRNRHLSVPLRYDTGIGGKTGSR